MAKRDKIAPDPTPLSDNPFAALALTLPEGPASVADPDVPGSADPVGLAFGARLVVRRQKKGQGGKAATFIEGLPAPTRECLCAQVKRALGCAARLEGAALVVGTAEHRRVARWLEELGAPVVVLGN